MQAYMLGGENPRMKWRDRQRCQGASCLPPPTPGRCAGVLQQSTWVPAQTDDGRWEGPRVVPKASFLGIISETYFWSQEKKQIIISLFFHFLHRETKDSC